MRALIGLYLAVVTMGCQQSISPARRVVVGPTILPVVAAEEQPEKDTPRQVVVEIKPAPVVPDQPIAELAPRKIILINLAHNDKRGQYFVAIADGRDVLSGAVSGAVTDFDSPLDHHPEEPHNHLGRFWVTARRRLYHSRAHDCDMPYSLFFHNGFGHAIHACQPRDIDKLGQPASHGCLRVSPANARKLFEWVGDDPVAVLITRE